MGSADWTDLPNQATDAEVLGQVTMCPTLYPPEGDFCFGFRSLTSSAKFKGRYYNHAVFAPLAASKGGSIHAYVRKDSPMSSACLYAPVLFYVNSIDYDDDPEGYILGLSEGVPYYVTLCKGKLSSGVKTTSCVAKGATGYSAAQWIGLRFDFIFNPQGDLVFNVYVDADTNPAGPDWQRPTGISAAVVDDNLGKLTGSAPNTDRMYMGFGMYSAQADCYAAFDYVRMRRQLTP